MDRLEDKYAGSQWVGCWRREHCEDFVERAVANAEKWRGIHAQLDALREEMEDG